MDAPVRRSRFAGEAGRGPIRVSFEFFPPKTAEMEQTLWESIERLAPLAPAFVSVTYGAGGSTRERTHATVKRILAETALVPAAHLTCVAATRAEIDEVIRAYHAAGVRHIVALRGDPTGGVGERYAPHPGGYANAADLAAGIRGIADVEVSVSAYPEKHPDSPTVEADIDMLKAKVDAGAKRAITQFFFENECYFRYVERVRARGISIPIVPGILPVQNFKQTRAFAERCFYTMNRADLVYAVCHLLGLRPASAGKQITDAEGRGEAVQQGTPSPCRGEGRGEGVTVAPGTTSAAS
jgi:methylenetetrahydrofolate reductase (NADPH)